jgi:hypothetical protein
MGEDGTRLLSLRPLPAVDDGLSAMRIKRDMPLSGIETGSELIEKANMAQNGCLMFRIREINQPHLRPPAMNQLARDDLEFKVSRGRL